MPIYQAHGGLTALSHADREFPVVGGRVELPDGETWYLDLVTCGQLAPAPRQAEAVDVALATSDTASASVPAEASAPAAPEPISEPTGAAQAETAPADPPNLTMFAPTAAPEPAKNPRRRGGRS